MSTTGTSGTRQQRPLAGNNFAVKLTYGTQSDARFWTKCSRVKKSYGSAVYSDGQSNIKFKLPTSVTYDDVTISKPMLDTDDTLIKLLAAANISPTSFLQVDIQPQYLDGYYSSPVGGIISLKYCTLTSLSFPDIDSNGDAVAMIEAVISPGYITSSGSKMYWIEPTSSTSSNATA